jgi:hypothetical protein
MVMHSPDIPAPDPSTERYYRGGGVYMSNGRLWIDGCTIVENQVTGYAATFHWEPNMSGGGAAATVGDAHVVEDMQVRHSIIAGNTVGGEPGDLFTGSLVDFKSWGYNLIGEVNFDYILAPVPWWSYYLSRKHYPKEGDRDGLSAADILSFTSIQYHPSIASAGVSPGQNAVLWYPPAGDALDAIPAAGYTVTHIETGFAIASSYGETDGFLEDVLDAIVQQYGQDYSRAFSDRDLSAITFYGPAVTWPDPEDHPENQDWIAFWRDLDAAIADSPGPLGREKLADDFWERFHESGNGPPVMNRAGRFVEMIDTDQTGTSRPAGTMGDVGAVEVP